MYVIKNIWSFDFIEKNDNHSMQVSDLKKVKKFKQSYVHDDDNFVSFGFQIELLLKIFD